MARRLWSLSELIKVAEHYPEEGPGRLAAVLGRSEGSVTGFARRTGLRSTHRRERQARSRADRSPSVDPGFFDEPSPDVAYALGFVFGCGSVKTHTRHVLRIRCPLDRERALSAVLAMMGSKHTPQRGRRRVLVEVCNSSLVRSLTSRYGRPPDPHDPDPPAPTISEGLDRYFAQGHLDATGKFNHREVTWSGSPEVVRMMRDAIDRATGVTPSAEMTVGLKMIVSYRGPVQLLALRRWLLTRRVE